MEVGYTFVSYYKYGFVLKLDSGETICNIEQDSGDIYRLIINGTGTAMKIEDEDGVYYQVDGTAFRVL